MKILSIDTSTNNFSIAVADDEEILASRDVVLKKVLEDSIVPAIEQILKKAKLKLSELDGFAVGLGPGSFTSLRVGLSTIKALSLATNKPVVGVSSLDAIAMNVAVIGQSPLQICVVTDARRQMVYACLYQLNKGQLRRQSDYLLTPPQELLKKVKGPTVFIGDGILLVKEHLSQQGQKTASFASEKLWYPTAAAISHLAWPKFKARKIDDVDRLVPLYLYPEDCQVRN